MKLSKFLKSPFELLDQAGLIITIPIGFLSDNTIAKQCTVVATRKIGKRNTDTQEFQIVLNNDEPVVAVGYTGTREDDNIPGIFVIGIIDFSKKVVDRE